MKFRSNRGPLWISLLLPTIRHVLLIFAALTPTYTEGAVGLLFDGKTLGGWEGNPNLAHG